MKKIIIVLVFLLLISNCTQTEPEKATVKGTVLYYHNKHQGFNPDSGAEVFLLNHKFLEDIDTLSIKNYLKVRFFKQIKSEFTDEELHKKLKKLNAETEEKFKELDKKSFNAVTYITVGTNNIETIVDGNGNFSILVEPGKYVLLIVSENRDSFNTGPFTMTETSGKIKFDSFKLAPGEIKFISVKFQELMMY